jgi:putative phosphotransacetylase
MTPRKVPIEVSARHIHISAEDLGLLFGPQAELTIGKHISQPKQFSANETVTVIGPKSSMEVRIVGPIREHTQVELSATDCHRLGIKADYRLSGDIAGTPGCRLVGPRGEVEIKEGVMVACRHLHISPEQASLWNLKHGDRISIKITGQRPLTFHDVYVKSREGWDELSFMIDTDEANAAGLNMGDAAQGSGHYGTVIEN